MQYKYKWRNDITTKWLNGVALSRPCSAEAATQRRSTSGCFFANPGLLYGYDSVTLRF